MILDNMPRGLPRREGVDQSQIPKAQWGDPARIVNSSAMQWDPSRIFLGAIGNTPIGMLDDRHICTVAGSRAGKGVSVIIPNLIHYKGSILAIDPKGELASITAKRRAEDLGQKVCVLDPFDRTAPWVAPYKKSYNPLVFLEPGSPTLIEDAGLIADSLIISSTGGTVDPHWDESARNFIEAVLLHIVTAKKYGGRRNLVTAHELLTRGAIFERGDKHYEGVIGLTYEMLESAEKLDNEDAAIIIDGAAVDMQDRGDNERGSVMSTIHRHVKFISYRPIKNILTGHDFSLSELKTAANGMTVYLCLPAGRMNSCNRWLRLFFNLALETMERLGQGRPATGLPVLFVLDEFAVLGHMRQIEDAAGQIASFHVKLWPILQDLTQLKTLYKERWETFLGNAGILQFFGNNDLTTLEFIQKRLGKTPVKTRKESFEGTKAVQNVSYSMEMHDLITAEEASRYFSRDDPQRRQLVIWPGHDPMVLQRVVYHDQKNPLYELFRGCYDEWQ